VNRRVQEFYDSISKKKQDVINEANASIIAIPVAVAIPVAEPINETA
jgi:hypothetical protein